MGRNETHSESYKGIDASGPPGHRAYHIYDIHTHILGPGRLNDDGKAMPMEVKKGDKILYGKYSGTEVSIEGNEFLIMRESDIYAVIKNS